MSLKMRVFLEATAPYSKLRFCAVSVVQQPIERSIFPQQPPSDLLIAVTPLKYKHALQ
jgi:hypothetical protein